ncbi:MAG: hypothetical protein RLZZ628_3305, partial [Bacteroidota bacterium]|jgi:hypothetical protein
LGVSPKKATSEPAIKAAQVSNTQNNRKDNNKSVVAASKMGWNSRSVSINVGLNFKENQEADRKDSSFL